jgi:hypothetical protein
MKHRIIVVTLSLLATMLFVSSSIVSPTHAQTVPGAGISELVCVLGVDGEGTYGRGELIVTVSSDDGSTAVVTVQHGRTSSTHTVTYEDIDADGKLNCGDTVTSVT